MHKFMKDRTLSQNFNLNIIALDKIGDFVKQIGKGKAWKDKENDTKTGYNSKLRWY